MKKHVCRMCDNPMPRYKNRNSLLRHFKIVHGIDTSALSLKKTRQEKFEENMQRRLKKITQTTKIETNTENVNFLEPHVAEQIDENIDLFPEKSNDNANLSLEESVSDHIEKSTEKNNTIVEHADLPSKSANNDYKNKHKKHKRSKSHKLLSKNGNIDLCENNSDEEYINMCVKSYKQKKKKLSEVDFNKKNKRCQKCKSFKDAKKFLFCDVCEDAYHSYCVDEMCDPFMCQTCNHMNLACNVIDAGKNLVEKTMCYLCKTKINNEKYKCEKCKNIFHSGCFNDYNKNTNICGACESKILKDKIFLKQYFEKCAKQPLNIYNSYTIEDEIKKKVDLYIAINKKILKIKKNKKFNTKLIIHEMDEKNIKKSRDSIFYSINAKGFTFCDDLVFSNKNCPPELNNALIECGIQEISDENKKIYHQFKEKSRIGIYAPLEVSYDAYQGFIVKALEEMQPNTILCEYAGDVALLRDSLFSDNDSIMDLIRTPDADVGLCILPQKFTNIGKFFSGINNSDPNAKANVCSHRLNIDGSVHIILVTNEKIKKNDILCYDYNGCGYYYPTDYFVSN